MTYQIQLIYSSILIFVISIFLFSNYKKITKNLNLIDTPSEQSVHKNPVPTGAGIFFFIIFIVCFALFFIINDFFVELLPKNYFVLVFGITFLSIISFYDDLKKIHPIIRLTFQVTIIMLCISSLYLGEFFLPLKVTIFLVVYFWVYLINIINFTDGSDGFLATNSISFFLAIIILQTNTEITSTLFFSLFILPTILAFYFFNKPPAKIFMGDSGSIFLGFFIGYISFETILNGYYSIIISLLAYSLIDCTTTLIKKTIKGNYPWARMFDYYFLIPIKNTHNHQKVFIANSIYNFINLIIVVIQIIYGYEILCIMSIFLSILLIKYYKGK